MFDNGSCIIVKAILSTECSLFVRKKSEARIQTQPRYTTTGAKFSNMATSLCFFFLKKRINKLKALIKPHPVSAEFWQYPG